MPVLQEHSMFAKTYLAPAHLLIYKGESEFKIKQKDQL